MTEMIHTCSGAISLAKKLEEESAEFYKALAERIPEHNKTFTSFADENKKFYLQIQRAYYGVISDALEGCFSFNINPDDYKFETKLEDNIEISNMLKAAIEMEDKIISYYNLAAEQSQALMADVPRAFKLTAKKREKRQSVLQSL